MKEKRHYSIIGKTVAFILLLLSLVCIPVGAIGTYYLISEGFYIADAESLKDNYLEEYFDDLGKAVLYTFYKKGEVAANQLLEGESIHYRVITPIGKNYGNYKKGVSYEWSKVYNYTKQTAGYYSFYEIGEYYLEMLVPEHKEYPDYVAVVCFFANNSHVLKALLPTMAIGGLVLGICCFVYLMCAAGWKCKEAIQTSGAFGFVPTDIFIIFIVALIVWILRIFGVWFSTYELMIKSTIGLVLAVLVLMIGLISISARVKAGTIWRHSVLGWLWKLPIGLGKVISGVVKNLPAIWRSVIIAAVITLLELLVLLYVYPYVPDGYYLQQVFVWVIVLWILEKVLLSVAAFFVLQRLDELKLAGKELAEGNSDYKVDTTLMFGDLKEHAENLNSISDGVVKAVTERMKSEHFKTELITNVSHDIKTPLTSIINYSDLLCKEETDNEKIKEYSDVLYRQSSRLKKLIEDLVEASKASTGNIEVNMEPCDVGVLLMQAAGEYEQRMFEKSISLISKQPENSVRIMADPKLLWRIFDNLMTNICKYSQSGTRVYLAVEEKENKVIISFKNISEYPLDISPEELMERFVRGDRSRHTEGNGLGLNIAKSLTELQNGSLDLSVDGDLFKVLLTFPVVQ